MRIIIPPPRSLIAAAVAGLFAAGASAASTVWTLDKNLTESELRFEVPEGTETPYGLLIQGTEFTSYALNRNVYLSVSNKGTYTNDIEALVQLHPSRMIYTSNDAEINLSFINEGSINGTAFDSGITPLDSQIFINKGTINSQDTAVRTYVKKVDFINEESGVIKTSGEGSNSSLHFKSYSDHNDCTLAFLNYGTIESTGTQYYVLTLEHSSGDFNADLTNLGTIKGKYYLVELRGKAKAQLHAFKIPVRNYIFYAHDFYGAGSFLFESYTKLILTPDDATESDTTLNLFSKSSEDPGIFIGSDKAIDGTVTDSNFSTNDEESWKVELIRDEATPDDWKTHKVRVYYEARQDAGSQMNVYLNRAARDRAFRYESLLEPMKVRKDRNVFVRPFTAQSNYRFVDDSTIKTSGALMGFSVRTGDAYEHGVHFGYESTDFESESGRQNADTDSLTLGYHAWWRPAEDFYVKGVASGTYSSNDFTYHALQDSAKTDFDSWSFFGYLKSGYDINAGGLGVFTPEVGLSYIHGSADDFGLDFAAEDLTDRRFHLKDNNDLYASAELKWRAEIDNGSGAVLLPRASIGARALLTDRKLEAQSSWGEERQTAEIDDDRWQGTAEIGVGILSGSLEFDLVYSGAYSRNTTSHAAWLTMGWHW